MSMQPLAPRRGSLSIAGALILLAAALGVALGLGGFTFVYADGHAYLRDDPQVCANCHVMRPQLDGWAHGSHKAVATCNSCHTPAEGWQKWWVKGKNGFNHSLAMTVGEFAEPIQITPANRAVTEAACRHCHDRATDQIELHSAEPLSCIRCHEDVGHAH
jgi:cytochrome c nitrite reductase small subunit